VVAINALLLQLSRPMEFIGYTVSEVRQSLADMDAMARLLLLPDTPTAVRPSVGPADAPPSDVNSLPLTPPEVRFEGVSYRYPNASVPALDHVSFVAPAGGTTVLVGTSGSGKSTALRLLSRLRDADSGTVNAWGRDVRGVTGAALRQRIGFVTQARRAVAATPRSHAPRALRGCCRSTAQAWPTPHPCLHRAQEPTLFDDTVLYNIRFGAFEAPVERSRAAAAAAALDGSLARWPQGLETRVGERGAQLSGGERQRVTVARALLREPPLLLADEATSAADALTEAELITALRAVRCTLITAAHRLSAITPNADHVVVFKAGRVAEQGTHTALLAQDGEYRRLWRTQEQER
jgi:ABC-type multidrug transport system fused ATPase/permease subunit